MSTPQARRWQKLAVVCASLLIATLICAILYWAKSVLIPVAVAVLLTFLLSPVVMRLDRWGLRRVPSVILVVGTVCCLIAGMLWLVTSELNMLANDLPTHQRTINEKFRQFAEFSKQGALGKVTSMLEEGARVLQGQPERAVEPEQPQKPKVDPTHVRIVADDRADSVLNSVFGSLVTLSPALDVLATAGLALLLLIFMLIKREDLRNRLISLTSGSSVTVTTKAMDDAGKRISRYLFMQLIINGSFGLFVGTGLFFIGVPYASLWGLCAAVFRYVPYIGPWIAAIMPLALTLIMFPGWTHFVLTLSMFVVLELISNNVLETVLYGQGTGVSEVALLVAATFWTVIWGPMGLILATPLTVCLVVLGKYVPALGFLDKILGDAPVLAPHVTLVQRILAKDVHEAKEIIGKQCSENALDNTFDQVFLPALSLVRKERLRNHMTAEEETLVFETLRQSLLSCSDEPAPDPEHRAPVPEPPIRIMGVPAHHEVDEVTLEMFDRFLRPHGFRMDVVSTRLLPSEIFARVAAEEPALVVIAVQPPGGYPQALYLCKQLRKRFPDLSILVGVWRISGNLDNVIVKFRRAGASYFATTFQGALSHALSMASSLRRMEPAMSANGKDGTLVGAR